MNYLIGIFVLFFSVIIFILWLGSLFTGTGDVVLYLGLPIFWIVLLFFGFSQFQNTSWTISKEKFLHEQTYFNLGETKLLISNIQSIELPIPVGRQMINQFMVFTA